MSKLRKICDEHCILLIADEIQTGFGRTGKLFAYEHFDIVPDIMTIGKAFGGGMPIGGQVTSQKIMSLFTTNPPLGHITTFGASMCCAGALAGLEVLENENIISNVEQKGVLFESLLNHKMIKEIRRKDCFLL